MKPVQIRCWCDHSGCPQPQLVSLACYAKYLEEAAQAAQAAQPAPVSAPQLFSEEMHELKYFYPATIAAQCRAAAASRAADQLGALNI